jgi:hypothetical protein
MDCDGCGKLFSTRSNLLKHKQTAKYCMKIREDISSTVKSEQFTCPGCRKDLSSKQRLNSHQKLCEKYTQSVDTRDATIEHQKIVIEKLEKRVRELELDIKEIALKSRGKTTTNNATTYVYQNFTPITDEKLKQDSINFTKGHLELGGQGIAHYALKNVLKDNFMCTDISRGHSKYIDGDGDLVVDPYSHTIARRVCESLIEPAEKINIANKSTLSGITPDDELVKAVMLNDAVKDIKDASSGVNNELTREFAKTICSGSVKKC